ncbi:MAG: HAMP domain-containing protein [Aquabacterium sp.]|nr:MAG: HAMP domain-containing protein [Aquabacterium sp.]
MTRATRWALLISAVAVFGAGLVLAFLLVLATNNREIYERHYEWLFWVNVGIAGALLLVIGFALLRLTGRFLTGKFGSRLLIKLAGIFGLVGVVPGVLIYLVSYQFVTRSIESWFDVRVEGALEAGLSLARSTLDASTADLAAKARLAAEQLADARDTPQPIALERMREQLAVQSIAVLDESGQIGALSGPDRRSDTNAGLEAPVRPPSSLLREARSKGVTASIEGLDDEAPPSSAAQARARVRAIAWMPAGGFSLFVRDRYVMLTRVLPVDVVTNALAVQAANREYQQRALARDGLRKMYVGTLTLALILAVFGALLLAATLGQQLARPLLLLAEGVGEVARGDLSPKPVFSSRDELGGLTRSFADMTSQLAEARTLAQRSVAELDSARAHLQTILDNLTAGVIVFDAERRIELVNPGATRILRLPLSAYRGRPLEDVPYLQDFARSVHARYDQLESGVEAGERTHWQESYDLQTDPSHAPLALLVRGAALPGDAKLIVFDDITEVVSAQRSQAWGEVARRVAHEIKNPLTPIQLSAERLQHKLEAKLEQPDQQMLARSVSTIVNQVQALKQIVNEFRDFARLPTPKFAAIDLNAVVADVAALYGVAQESGRLVVDCAGDLVPIEGDATLLRQVIHNLVQNALDATAERADGRVRLATELRRDEQGQPRTVRLIVTDNGTGFPDKVLKRAFEPYVTTKTKGTGLGLAVVKKIADEHGAVVRLRNLTEAAQARANDSQQAAIVEPRMLGAQVSLSFSRLAPGHPPSGSSLAPAAPAHRPA